MNKTLQIVHGEDGSHLILVVDGETHIMRDDHKSFDYVLDLLGDGLWQEAADVVHNELLMVEKVVPKILAEGLTLEGEVLYYNGEPLYQNLTQTVLDHIDNQKNLTSIGNFILRVMKNPSRRSREQLYDFLNAHDFRITEDGYFIAYKGLNPDFTSIHAGNGNVNGEEFTRAHLDNRPGNVITMPREEVMDDPNAACSFGLHAGTLDYASNFGRRVVEVIIDPADVVSVPHDSANAKIRTCRYTVLREVDAVPIDSSFEAYSRNGPTNSSDRLEEFIEDYFTDDGEEEEYYCEECGEYIHGDYELCDFCEDDYDDGDTYFI